MNVPVPRNRLVAFTLAGALLTMAVAAGLALPGVGPSPTAESTGDTSGPTANTDAPEPAQNFTPDVQTGSNYEEHEDEEYEDGEDEEYEEDEEDGEYEDEDDEYEED